jgi:hypothetical protein
LLIGQAELQNTFYDLVLPWSYYDTPDCFVGSAEICRREPSDCLEKYTAWEEEYICPLYLIPDQWPWIFFQADMRHVKLCEECDIKIQDHFHQKRLELWEILPAIFGLPSWDIIASSGGPDG